MAMRSANAPLRITRLAHAGLLKTEGGHLLYGGIVFDHQHGLTGHVRIFREPCGHASVALQPGIGERGEEDVDRMVASVDGRKDGLFSPLYGDKVCQSSRELRCRILM